MRLCSEFYITSAAWLLHLLENCASENQVKGIVNGLTISVFYILVQCICELRWNTPAAVFVPGFLTLGSTGRVEKLKGGHEGEKRVTNIFPVLKRFNPPFCKIVFRIWPKMKSVLSSGKFLPTFLSFTLKTCVLGLATWLYTSLAHSKV